MIEIQQMEKGVYVFGWTMNRLVAMYIWHVCIWMDYDHDAGTETWQPVIPANIRKHTEAGIYISLVMTCCVILITPTAAIQIAEVGPNAPARVSNFDMHLGARAKINPVIKK